MDAKERLKLAIAKVAHQEAIESGYAGFFEESFGRRAEEVGASEQDVRRVVRELTAEGLLSEDQPRYWKATPALFLDYEAGDRAEAYRQNEARRVVLDAAGRADAEGASWATFCDETDPHPQKQLFVAATVLDWLGFIERDSSNLATYFSVRLAARGHELLEDERLLRRALPVTPTEDEDAHAPVAADALRQVIISCEQMLEKRGWGQALVELGRGDVQYSEADWVNAVREYYSALESGLKYALHEEGADYGEGTALKKLAGRAADVGLIPTNYQSIFSFTDSIRSPRSHGAGPESRAGVEVEIGQAEALLVGNLVRTLLLYVGNRPEV